MKKIVFLTLLCFSLLKLHVLGQDGVVDPVFGTVVTSVPGGYTGDSGIDMEILSDGKIMVLTPKFELLRYNPDGSLDITFDSDGILNNTGIDGFSFAMITQSDGKILVAGSIYNAIIQDSETSVVRYNPDGTLDVTFDTDGIAAVTGTYTGLDIALQADGKIIVLAEGAKYQLKRLNTDGTPDNTFASSEFYLGTGGYSYPYAIAIQGDDKIVAAGFYDSLYNKDVAIARFNANGGFDNSFSNDGKLVQAIGTEDEFLQGVAIDQQNRILVAGQSKMTSGDYDVLMLRYLNDGTMDASFDQDGIATSHFNYFNGATSIAFQEDGKIVIGGYTGSPGSTSFLAARYNMNGSLDPTFNNNGSTIIPFSSNASCYDLKIQPDKKIVLVGGIGSSGYYDVGVIRLNGSCLPPDAPSLITGQNSVCSGSSATYSVVDDPDVITSSYVWTLPNGWTGSSTTNTISVTAGSGSGNITVTPQSNCGTSGTKSLALLSVAGIPAVPDPIIGASTICKGVSADFSVAAVPTAESYIWTLPSGWTGSSSTASITLVPGSTSGPISVMASNACGNSTATTLAITVAFIPVTPGTISGPNQVCPNSSQTYSINAVSNATDYIWTLPNGWTGSSTSTTINATASATPGNILVKANNSLCGSSSSKKLIITMLPAPSKPTLTLTGNTFECSPSANGYQWNLDDVPISGATAQTYTYTTNGIYTVTVFGANGCFASSDPINTSGLDESTPMEKISVHPNPTAGDFVLKLDGPSEQVSLSITDASGRKIYADQIISASENVIHLDAPAGIYFLTVQSNKNKSTLKLIKQ